MVRVTVARRPQRRALRAQALERRRVEKKARLSIVVVAPPEQRSEAPVVIRLSGPLAMARYIRMIDPFQPREEPAP